MGVATASKLPPGPSQPRLLQAFDWVRKPAALMEEGRERYGDVWTLGLLGHTTFVLVSDPQLVEQIFTTDPTLLHAGEADAAIGSALLGQHSVLVLDEEAHTKKRKLLQPPFHHEQIQHYHDAIVRIVEEEIDSWPLHQPLELFSRMQSITLRSIMSVIFGVTGGAPQERLHERITTMLGWAKPWNMARIHVAHRRGTAMPKGFLNVRGPFDDAVFEEISRAKQDPRLEERDDILAMLLKTRHEDGTAMEDRDLRDQMTTLLIQGHQTTAAALAWALERLMRHPEALERLRADVQNDQDEYLDAVFKETLRIRPPLPIIPRMVVKQPYQLGEYEIPVGAMVVPCIYMLHRHPDVYDEPKRFRPERFLEQPEGRYTWIPFGGGDRHCVGRSFATAEFKTALRLIVQRVRLTPTEQKDEKIARRGILFAPGSGAKAIIQERVEAPASRVAA